MALCIEKKEEKEKKKQLEYSRKKERKKDSDQIGSRTGSQPAQSGRRRRPAAGRRSYNRLGMMYGTITLAIVLYLFF